MFYSGPSAPYPDPFLFISKKKGGKKRRPQTFAFSVLFRALANSVTTFPQTALVLFPSSDRAPVRGGETKRMKAKKHIAEGETIRAKDLS